MQQVTSSNVCCWLILVALDIMNKLFYQLVCYLRLVCVGMEWYKTFVPYNKDTKNVEMYAISGSMCFCIKILALTPFIGIFFVITISLLYLRENLSLL